MNGKIYKRFIKRYLDLIIGVFLLALLGLPLIVLMIINAFVFNGNPVFLQKRVGVRGEVFSIFKLKSLASNTSEVSPWGMFLRSSSLDEWPQLINVIKGNMSLVGPRPLLPEYLPYYNEFECRRHEVLPGITGWVQVRGRNNLSWPDRFKLDVYYVDHQSFLLDLRILLLTFMKLFDAKNANGRNEVSSFIDYAKARDHA